MDRSFLRHLGRSAPPGPDRGTDMGPVTAMPNGTRGRTALTDVDPCAPQGPEAGRLPGIPPPITRARARSQARLANGRGREGGQAAAQI